MADHPKKEVWLMSIFETLTLMIAFATLIALVINGQKNNYPVGAE